MALDNEVLELEILFFLRQYPSISLFQQDNARPFSARLTADYRGQNTAEFLPWSANSLDLIVFFFFFFFVVVFF